MGTIKDWNPGCGCNSFEKRASFSNLSIRYVYECNSFCEGEYFYNLHKSIACVTLVAIFSALCFSDTDVSCPLVRFILMESTSLRTGDVFNPTLGYLWCLAQYLTSWRCSIDVCWTEISYSTTIGFNTGLYISQKFYDISIFEHVYSCKNFLWNK